jgi:aspartate/glutamate racemase
MAGPVHPRAFATRGIAAELPAAEDRRPVDRIIFQELVNGVMTTSSRRAGRRLIRGTGPATRVAARPG